MTKEEAIKYLQEIYPHGGHCWLDEQRIEAISMAIDVLSQDQGKAEWIKELEAKLQSVSKDEFQKIMQKYEEECDLKEEPISEDLVKFADWQSIEYRNQRESCGLKDPITLDEAEEANYAGIMAGAQWQKQQGVTKEAVIGMATEEIAINVSQSLLDVLDLCAGDKIVIQLMKKKD